MNRNVAATSRSQRGFSLAEVLTATAIFALIFVAALVMYDRSNRVYKQGVEAADTQQNTRVAFDKLVAELRMTGFDYDRDGSPTSSMASTWQPNAPYSIGNLVEPDPPNGFVYRVATGGTSAATQPVWKVDGTQTTENAPSTVVWQKASEVQYQQPDEQIEYAGPAVVGVRANFDYDLEIGGSCITAGDPCQNGRETNYESADFPLVTTGNDEIVIYALRPVNDPGNLPQLTFYADMSMPRSVNPGSGTEEDAVDLPRVYDPCTGGCNNPPYTLYRITFEDEDGVNFVETPVAENIRSMNIRYFRDAAGTDEIAVADLPGGAGQWDGDDPYATIDERDLRADIRSMRINLVGMNPQPDGAYTDPTDTVAPQHRKYQLETLIVPRNIGRHGMKEFNTANPQPPTLDVVCAGSCNAVYLSWTAATTGGDVESYNILYDTSAASCVGGVSQAFTYAEDAGKNLEGYAAMWITPGQTYYFAVQAVSKYGNAVSNCMSANVINTTKPEAPASLSASGDGVVPTQENQVSLYWPPVEENDDAAKTVPCTGGVPRETKKMPAAEARYYRIYKSKDATVDPADPDTEEILNENSTIQPTFDGTNIVLVDTKTANCLPYYYRIMTVDHCIKQGSWNTGGTTDLAKSAEYFPPLGTDGIRGEAAEALTPPAAPTGLAVVNDTCAAGLCDVEIAWGAVTKNHLDPTGPDITIDEYVIRAEMKDATGNWVAAPLWPTNPAMDENSVTGEVLTATLTGVIEGTEYQFYVRAKDCIDGEESSPLFYPCTFAGGVVTISPSDTFGGDGSAGNPYVIEAPATINVSTENPIAEVTATFSQGGTSFGGFTATGPTSAVSIPLPAFADGAVAVVTITVSDGSGTTCVLPYTIHVIDQPPPDCALEDDQSNNSILTWTVAADRQVFVNLTNTSPDQIRVNRIFVRWNPRNGNGRTNLLESVDFPTGNVVSNCGLDETTITAPAGTFVPGTSTRSLTINFRRNGTQAIQANPVASVCVEYQSIFGDVLGCQVAPTSGTCSIPGSACQ